MNSTQIRISYADTDQMGMVYYGNYLTYFERGRTEWLRELGFDYKSVEARGLYLPVLHAECNYHAPAKYDDIITIETKLTNITAASMTFNCQVKANGKLLVSGSTKLTMVNASFKPVRIPADIKSILEQNLES
ncbi:MAG: acyl-CoA thioesterase [Elusimicrobia bacterium]|nr:acyl-CoA thioesterase [Elusimicrobiota bacterium]